MTNYEALLSTPERAAMAIAQIIYCCTIDKNCSQCPLEEVAWDDDADFDLQSAVTPCAFPYNVMMFMESEIQE